MAETTLAHRALESLLVLYRNSNHSIEGSLFLRRKSNYCGEPDYEVGKNLERIGAIEFYNCGESVRLT